MPISCMFFPKMHDVAVVEQSRGRRNIFAKSGTIPTKSGTNTGPADKRLGLCRRNMFEHQKILDKIEKLVEQLPCRFSKRQKKPLRKL